MKKLQFLLFALVLTTTNIGAQTLSFDLPRGSKAWYRSTDRKGNIESRTITSVDSIGKAADRTVYTVGDTYIDKNGTPITDDDGKPLPKLSHQVIVTANELTETMDMASIFAQMNMDNHMKMTVTGKQAGYPRKPIVGSLPDFDMKFTMNVEGSNMNLSVNVKGRKRAVVGRETVTTETGTFDCWKFTERVTVAFGIFKETTVENSWYAEGVGLVKSESCTSRGKVESTTILTAIERAE